MKNNIDLRIEEMIKSGLDPGQEDIVRRELEIVESATDDNIEIEKEYIPGFYDYDDIIVLNKFNPPERQLYSALQTLDELLERDKQREEDGFPRRIRIGKIVRPSKNNKDQIVVVPSTTEPKFYHDSSTTEEEDQTGGSGDGEEGEVIGEQEVQPKPGEGQGEGAGKGEEGEHDVSSEAYDLGKVLTEKFSLPNLKDKGKKRSLTKFKYDLTDRNRGFGQTLDKKATMRKIIATNIMLGNVTEAGSVNAEDLIINPKDQIYQILSKEKDFETQAVVFFLRDYSGSMQGPPTEVVATLHLFIYSWLMYQYHNNVESRFILHDQQAKEVPDFYTYHNSQIAGGTNVYPAYELVNKIVEEEQLAKDYNIYIFHGTDGDDWDSDGQKATAALRKMLTYTNRVGLTIARNSWGGTGMTTVEKYMDKSGMLKDNGSLIKLDSMVAADADEARIIKGIKKLVE